MIDHIIERLREVTSINQIILATGPKQENEDLAKHVQSFDVATYYDDDVNDVTGRIARAGECFNASFIITISGDCPLIDPILMDEVITVFFKNGVDFAANRLPPPYTRTYPIGLDIEVASFSALEKAWRQARLPFEREHVMPYLYSVKDRFSIFILDVEKNYGNRRWTVDTPEDLEFIRALFNKLNCRINFSWHEVLQTLEKNPELEKINADIAHKSFRDIDNRASIESGKDKE